MAAKIGDTMSRGSIIPIAGMVLLAVLAACTPPQTAGSEQRSMGPVTSPSENSAACHVTPGEPPQAFGFAATAASEVRLAPGMDLATSPETLAASRRGEQLRVYGQVLASDCATPIEGAIIQVWQTNGDGDYGPPGVDGHPRCCYLTATLTTDAAGNYEILTVMPGHYRDEEPSPPAHIHFDVRPPTGLGVMTELDFAGDPALSGHKSSDGDPHAIVSLHRATRSNQPLQARFDIVLGKP
jgi:protocatechuate 3,4-dioxygenase beta subunit